MRRRGKPDSRSVQKAFTATWVQNNVVRSCIGHGESGTTVWALARSRWAFPPHLAPPPPSTRCSHCHCVFPFISTGIISVPYVGSDVRWRVWSAHTRGSAPGTTVGPEPATKPQVWLTPPPPPTQSFSLMLQHILPFSCVCHNSLQTLFISQAGCRWSILPRAVLLWNLCQRCYVRLLWASSVLFPFALLFFLFVGFCRLLCWTDGFANINTEKRKKWGSEWGFAFCWEKERLKRFCLHDTVMNLLNAAPKTTEWVIPLKTTNKSSVITFVHKRIISLQL